MLNWLRGPRPLNGQDISFLNDRFRDGKTYLPFTYFVGSTPDNNYTPTQPYTIRVESNHVSAEEQGYACAPQYGHLILTRFMYNPSSSLKSCWTAGSARPRDDCRQFASARVDIEKKHLGNQTPTECPYTCLLYTSTSQSAIGVESPCSR